MMVVPLQKVTKFFLKFHASCAAEKGAWVKSSLQLSVFWAKKRVQKTNFVNMTCCLLEIRSAWKESVAKQKLT